MSILVVESGSNGSEDVLIKYPALFAHILDPNSKYTLTAEGNASDKVAGRKITIPHGHVLGGGSTANMMTYSRPYTYDFESWNTPGWSYEDVLPYFKKVDITLPKALILEDFVADAPRSLRTILAPAKTTCMAKAAHSIYPMALGHIERHRTTT